MGFLFKERNEKMNSDQPAINAVRERVANQSVPSHVERMQLEAIELSMKIEKLSAFIGTPTYQALPVFDATLLLAQHQAMSAYRTILGLRITSASLAAEYQSTARQDVDYADIHRAMTRRDEAGLQQAVAQQKAKQDDAAAKHEPQASGEILDDGVRFAKPEDPEPIPFA